MELKICTIGTAAGLAAAALMLMVAAWTPAAQADSVEACQFAPDGLVRVLCLNQQSASVAEMATGVSASVAESGGATSASAAETASARSLGEVEFSASVSTGVAEEGPERSASRDNYTEVLR